MPESCQIAFQAVHGRFNTETTRTADKIMGNLGIKTWARKLDRRKDGDVYIIEFTAEAGADTVRQKLMEMIPPDNAPRITIQGPVLSECLYPAASQDPVKRITLVCPSSEKWHDSWVWERNSGRASPSEPESSPT